MARWSTPDAAVGARAGRESQHHNARAHRTRNTARTTPHRRRRRDHHAALECRARSACPARAHPNARARHDRSRTRQSRARARGDGRQASAYHGCCDSPSGPAHSPPRQVASRRRSDRIVRGDREAPCRRRRRARPHPRDSTRNRPDARAARLALAGRPSSLTRWRATRRDDRRTHR